MNGWLERPLVLVALLLAGVLVALGLRNRFSPRLAGKRGLFWAALSLFLLLGAKGVSPTTGQPAPNRGEDTGTKAAPDIAIELPPELAGKGRWEAFRALWKKLDQAALKRGGGENSPVFSMDEAVPREVRLALTVELAATLGCRPEDLYQGARIPKANPTSDGPVPCVLSLPVRVLVEVALARIWALGPDNTMMMHMMPPPELLYHNRLKANLQRRFEMIVAKRTKGKLTGEEFLAAMGTLEQEVFHLAIYHLAMNNPARNSGGTKGLRDRSLPPFQPMPGQPDAGEPGFAEEAEAWIAKEENLCKEERARLAKSKESGATLKALEQQCADMKAAFEELRKVRPAVGKLLMALERE